MSKYSNSLQIWRIFHLGWIRSYSNSKMLDKLPTNMHTIQRKTLRNRSCCSRSANLSLNLKVTRTNQNLLHPRNSALSKYPHWCWTSHSRYSNSSLSACIVVKTKKLRHLFKLLQPVFISIKLRGVLTILRAWITRYMIGGDICRTPHTTSLIWITTTTITVGSLKLMI